MKKIYTRPCIESEDFQITQQITSCGTFKIPLTSSTCVTNSNTATQQMKDLAAIGFFLDSSGCSMTAEDMSDGDGFCINTNINTAFTS